MCYVFVAFVISFTVSSTQWIPYLVKPRLNALVLFWWFYDWEIVMIWEFILMIFKSEDTVFLCHLLTACLLQLSRICLCFFFSFCISASFLPPVLIVSHWDIKSFCQLILSLNWTKPSWVGHELSHLPLSPEEFISPDKVLSGFSGTVSDSPCM